MTDNWRRSADPAELRLLGQQIRKCRKDSKMSMRQVASAAGFTASYLSILELGKNPRTGHPSRPSPNHILALATILAVEPEEWLSLAAYDRDEWVGATDQVEFLPTSKAAAGRKFWQSQRYLVAQIEAGIREQYAPGGTVVVNFGSDVNEELANGLAQMFGHPELGWTTTVEQLNGCWILKMS